MNHKHLERMDLYVLTSMYVYVFDLPLVRVCVVSTFFRLDCMLCSRPAPPCCTYRWHTTPARYCVFGVSIRLNVNAFTRCYVCTITLSSIIHMRIQSLNTLRTFNGLCTFHESVFCIIIAIAPQNLERLFVQFLFLLNCLKCFSIHSTFLFFLSFLRFLLLIAFLAELMFLWYELLYCTLLFAVAVIQSVSLFFI